MRKKPPMSATGNDLPSDHQPRKPPPPLVGHLGGPEDDLRGIGLTHPVEKGLHSSGNRRHCHRQQRQRRDDEHPTLDHIGRNHRADPTDSRVGSRDRCADQNRELHRELGQRRECDGCEIEPNATGENPPDHERQSGAPPGHRAEAVFDQPVYRLDAESMVERNQGS